MTNEVTIAYITAIASFFVAIVSLIGVLISNYQSKNSQKQIESLKYELENRRTDQLLANDILTDSIKSLDVLIYMVQRVKDVIQLIINSKDLSMDKESAKALITKVREDIFSSYELQLSRLDETEKEDAHNAKNITFIAEQRIYAILAKDEKLVKLTSKERLELSEIRNRLTDAQDRLRDSKTTKLLERLSK